MTLHLFTRAALVPPTVPSSRLLLLEGSWPAGPNAAGRDSLDGQIDGRFGWIDEHAARGAETLGGEPGDGLPPAAWVNALTLHYYLVRLLRVVAYFTEVVPLARGEAVHLAATRGRDDDYADLLGQLCSQAGAELEVHWHETALPVPPRLPANRLWRRWLAALARRLEPAPAADDDRPRVMLVGNPRLLEPVCRALQDRGARAWWLYDRFAVRAWLHDRPRGVGQLVCEGSLGRENRFPLPPVGEMACRGVDLAPAVGRWLADRRASHGPPQSRLGEQIDRHFAAVRPGAVLLDEDATPLARLAVAAARRHGAASLVVQHGLPVCSFGFVPLAADRILVWGRSSRQVLVDWGVPPERVRVTGSPRLDGMRRAAVGRRKPGALPVRILLLTIRPPQDDRPDAVRLHLTSESYLGMIRAAFKAVARLPRAELVVKTHPRAGIDAALTACRREFARLWVRVVRRGAVEDLFPQVDCVVSCGSTAGVEAAVAGLPVIGLAPPRATGFPRHEPWGLVGTAHDETELTGLLEHVLAGRAVRRDLSHVADFQRPAAARIAEEALGMIDEPRVARP